MEKYSRLPNVIVMFFWCVCLSGCGPKETRNAESSTSKISETPVYRIELRVNTAEITKPELERYCNFKSQPDSVSDTAFTTLVEAGAIIYWVGVSTSNPEKDEVMITQINHQGGERLLEKNIIKGDDSGIIMARVKSDVRSNQEEKYMIHFTVYVDGIQKNGTFPIDPKIRIP